MSELVVRKIADHFARQGGGGGFMGWVIRDPRIIWWGGGEGFGPPRISDLRTAYHTMLTTSCCSGRSARNRVCRISKLWR